MTKLFNYLTDKNIAFDFVPGSRSLVDGKTGTFVHFRIHGKLSFDDLKNSYDVLCPFDNIFACGNDLIIEFFV